MTSPTTILLLLALASFSSALISPEEKMQKIAKRTINMAIGCLEQRKDECLYKLLRKGADVDNLKKYPIMESEIKKFSIKGNTAEALVYLESQYERGYYVYLLLDENKQLPGLFRIYSVHKCVTDKCKNEQPQY